MQEIKSNQEGSAMMWVVIAVIVVALGIGAYMFMGKEDKDATEKPKSTTEDKKTDNKDAEEEKPAASQTQVKASVIDPTAQ